MRKYYYLPPYRHIYIKRLNAAIRKVVDMRIKRIERQRVPIRARYTAAINDYEQMKESEQHLKVA